MTTGFADAVFSPDGVYRYALVRAWARGPRHTWIMLNPSTADDVLDDPTVRRCIGFSRMWGAGGIRVVNLFALRSTDPSLLVHHPDPTGPHNNGVIQYTVEASDVTIAAWGAHPAAIDRAREVFEIVNPITRLYALGVTKAGQPRHPLYVKGDTQLVTWTPA
jgi:hypothetical protein